MVKFFQHTLTIPNLKLEFALKKRDVVKTWIDIMRTTGFGAHIRIDFKYLERNFDGSVVNFEYDLTTFYFSPVQDFFYPYHVDFISKIGRIVQSIDINKNTNERQLYQILESCRSLQTLTCRKPVDIDLYSLINFQHENLKFITLSIKGCDVSFDYITRLSLNLPNLEQLSLIDQKTFRLNNDRNIQMNMPNARLNMLSWSGESSSGIVHHNELRDKYSLLSAFLFYCPNIQQLSVMDLGRNVWGPLIYAAKEGQLAHLKSLSITRVAEIDNYIGTLLSFKNSLTTLLLCDADDTMITSRWSTGTTYQPVLDHIKEFSNLQHLSIGHHTDLQFYNFDRLIEKCRSLKSFSVRLNHITCQVQKENIIHRFISKSSDVNKLVCNWETIKSDDQIKYIIYKLPNLQYLNILYDPYLGKSFNRETQPISSNTLKNSSNIYLPFQQ
ncbi:hypothetical protein EDC94DRAFT_678891 [Helicostylum pulchrum]|nr:hypothetical protein EDC94DRAFT_678891 [Helicostylum pulchrum]